MKLTTLFMGLALCCACRAEIIIGLEDLSTYDTSFDADHNDATARVYGVDFHTLGPFTPPAPFTGYNESPFPQPAQFFDYGVATGPVIVAWSGGEASFANTILVRIGSSGWLPVPNTAWLYYNATAGDRVDFAVKNSYNEFYSDPAMNSDGYLHAVAWGTEPQVPEPATFLLIGGALVGLAWRRRRVNDL